MILSLPGDPIWLREGILIAKEIPSFGLPIGTILNRPCRGIFLERKTINSKSYVKAYVDNFGERFIEEDEVIELDSKGK